MKRDDQRTDALILPLDHSIAQTNNEHIPQTSDGGNNAYPPNELETKGNQWISTLNVSLPVQHRNDHSDRRTMERSRRLPWVEKGMWLVSLG